MYCGAYSVHWGMLSSIPGTPSPAVTIQNAPRQHDSTYVSYLVRFMETDSRMVVVRGWREEGMGSRCLLGTEFQFYKMKRVLELDGVALSTTV